VFGHAAQQRLAGSSVLVVGLQGLGVEVAKNVILAGVRAVGLLDDAPTTVADLGAQFYLSAAAAATGKPRAAACRDELATLNAYVDVHTVTAGGGGAAVAAAAGQSSPEGVVAAVAAALATQRYNVVVTTNCNTATQLSINALCRLPENSLNNSGVAFIGGDVRGLTSSVFVDVGALHVVSDADGEQAKRGLVTHVSNAASGVVIVNDEARHGLSDGDFVSFEEVEAGGMVELNETDAMPIKVS
jgi:ubiquitin-activating enzyme E1